MIFKLGMYERVVRKEDGEIVKEGIEIIALKKNFKDYEEAYRYATLQIENRAVCKFQKIIDICNIYKDLIKKGINVTYDVNKIKQEIDKYLVKNTVYSATAAAKDIQVGDFIIWTVPENIHKDFSYEEVYNGDENKKECAHYDEDGDDESFMVEVDVPKLNIRNNPSGLGERIGVLDLGDQVKILELCDCDDWGKIDLGNNNFGWINLNYVKVLEDDDDEEEIKTKVNAPKEFLVNIDIDNEVTKNLEELFGDYFRKHPQALDISYSKDTNRILGID